MTSEPVACIYQGFNLQPHPKIFAIGDRHLSYLFSDQVLVQEKVDGSQFGFAKVDGELYFRSKGKILYDENTTKSFGPAIVHLKEIAHKIPDNTVFYGEYLQKPRQNCITYDRIPRNHLVLFAARDLEQDVWYPSNRILKDYADLMEIEIAPVFKEGLIESVDELIEFMDRESFLGGSKIEGFVVKNYHREGMYGGSQILPFLTGKYVSDTFKEKNGAKWSSESRPSKMQQLKDSLKTEARWNKAIQHLRDQDLLTGTPRDIGPLLQRINADVLEEEEEFIKESLYKIFGKEVLRAVTYGFPEFYKLKLSEEGA